VVLVYASTTDLTSWTTLPAPADAAALLRSASLLVRSSTMSAIYTTDDTGAPTDAKVLQAFKDATCAQAAYWSAANIDPSSGGISTTAPVRSKRLGSGAIEYDTSVNASVTAFQAKQAATVTLCPEALMLLHQAAVVPGGVQRG
jgi:hypothetical protein